MPSTASDTSEPHRWRTPVAIGVGIMMGIPVGLFLKATAVPFGPILLGLFVALLVAIIVSAALSVLATDCYLLVGIAYPVGMSAAIVTASLIAEGMPDPWWVLPTAFAVNIAVWGLPSLLTVGLCVLLKWEDRKARERNREL